MNFLKTIILFLLLLITSSKFIRSQEYRLSFDIIVQNETTNLNRFSCFVLPNEAVSISINNDVVDDFSIYSQSGKVIEISKNHWQFESPEDVGHYPIIIQKLNSNETFTLLVFVMFPATQSSNGYLNKYQIGNYPPENYNNKKNYRSPKGFIEVNQSNKDLYISPHFQLYQFLCKQDSDWPKYVVVQSKMIRKLELIRERLDESGIQANTLFLMSAYRTPFYNKAIGNVKYSRHIYGDAIDIYVDENHDSKMDDLNKDGIINMSDTEVIQRVVNDIDNDPQYKDLTGGMGKYNKNAAHTYFIHIDTRGYKARW